MTEDPILTVVEPVAEEKYDEPLGEEGPPGPELEPDEIARLEGLKLTKVSKKPKK